VIRKKSKCLHDARDSEIGKFGELCIPKVNTFFRVVPDLTISIFKYGWSWISPDLGTQI